MTTHAREGRRDLAEAAVLHSQAVQRFHATADETETALRKNGVGDDLIASAIRLLDATAAGAVAPEQATEAAIVAERMRARYTNGTPRASGAGR